MQHLCKKTKRHKNVMAKSKKINRQSTVHKIRQRKQIERFDIPCRWVSNMMEGKQLSASDALTIEKHKPYQKTGKDLLRCSEQILFQTWRPSSSSCKYKHDHNLIRYATLREKRIVVTTKRTYLSSHVKQICHNGQQT